MNKKVFFDRIKHHESHLKKDTSISEITGYAKLLAILILGIVVYLLFVRNFHTILVIGLIVVLLTNIVLWVFHYRVHQKIKYSNSIIAINKRHLDRIAGTWADFQDIGAEFINPKHPYASDLDIVDKKSFFQFLNTTHTWFGRQAYANDLLHPQYTNEELSGRQEAITELSRDINFTNHIEHSFSKIGPNKSMRKLVTELEDKQIFIRSKVLKILLMYAPMVTFISIAAIILFRLESLFIPAILVIALQTVIWGFGMIKTQNFLGAISQLPYKLGIYSEIIGTVKSRSFDSKILQQIQEQLGTSELSAQNAIKDLSKISNKVSVRHNALIWVILNVLLLWDIECAIMFEKWKTKYAHVAEKWFLALGDFESMLCFSILPNVCANTCVPSVTSDKAIRAQQLGHPLITNDIRVNNDISCNDNIFIISGSNMSGKTTFMRTVGINMILARAGSFVCAQSMSFPLIKIMTSMRVADDLNEGISTFYAELKRIKGIITLAQKEPDMLFLIDEIFRGTNSVDRLEGAKAVLSKLNNIGALGIITTHDLDLCAIANKYPRIVNYSFMENYHDSQIQFDYKVKPGKSTTTNAKYLMQMVGISTYD